jgi:serine/threonine-protein kinase
MNPDTLYNFVQELKRRRVFRGIIVYGASTLVLFEAATNLANFFGRDSPPAWFVALLGIGFIGSLWFSWIYDFTPGGIKKTKPVSELKVPIPRKEVRTYQTTTFVSVLLIIGLLSYNIIDGAKSRIIAAIDKSIAVLPLNDIELNPNDARSFEFVGHEITSCLLKVKEYRVVPWEDCRKYKREGKSYPAMGNELSAAILVEWRAYETGIHKHLSVNLISADDGSLLLSEIFEIEGSWSEEISRHSRKISKMITRKLKTHLTPAERAFIDEQKVPAQARMFVSLGTAMTRDTWEMIQIGNEPVDTVENEYIDSISFEKAISYFTQAIKEDPTYAEAYAMRAKARTWGIRGKYFDSSVLDECEKDIRKAFELDADLPEAHVAMGFYYYYGISEFMLALTSFEQAVRLKPEDYKYLYYLSNIHRALGNWEEVQYLSDKVLNSNPRNALFLTSLGLSYLYLDDFNKAIECQDRAIELMPDWCVPYGNKIASLISVGDLTEARAVVHDAEKDTRKDYYRTLAELDLLEGKYTNAIDHIERAKLSEYHDLRETEGDMYLLKAKIYNHAGKQRKAKDNFELAVAYYQNLIMFNPEDYYSHSKLGLAYAGINMNQEAIKHGQIALELSRQKEDSLFKPFLYYYMIQIYTITGDNASALSMINDLMNIKSLFTSESIRLDPDLKHLLDKPGL